MFHTNYDGVEQYLKNIQRRRWKKDGPKNLSKNFWKDGQPKKEQIYIRLTYAFTHHSYSYYFEDDDEF